MQAIVRKKYGSPDVLQLKEVGRPTPSDDQVLVRVYAASINKSDWYELTAPFPVRLLAGGILKPKRGILGADIAGRVEAVGKSVKQFQPGDEVFGDGLWGFAEYVCAREARLALKPEDATFEESAAVPIAAITALQALRKGMIQEGQKVLIQGSSGGVGTFAVQIAKALGAEVTAVCSTANVENASSLGADHVIDYTKEDFAGNGVSYDLILGVNGHRSLLTYSKALGPRGTYIMVGGSRPVLQIIETVLFGRLFSRTGGKKMGFMGIAKLNQSDLNALKDLIEGGKVKPVIDRRFSFSQTAEAMRYLGEGHAKGKVVIMVNQES